MRNVKLLFAGFLLMGRIVAQSPAFLSPVDIQIYLAGSFGEIRADHFHSGIDIKTQGVTGKKVFSIEDGHISRIKVQTGGYGKALYIDHPGGYTSVYGHLENYSPMIDSFVRVHQYSKKSHEVDIFPGKDELLVKKGEIVAFTGNSGSSNGPHLHFEIRKAGNQDPLNPLKYGFKIKDNIPPKINALYVYQSQPGRPDSYSPVEYSVTKTGGVYRLVKGGPVSISGKGGFGLDVYDLLNDIPNHCGVYTIELSINNEPLYLFRTDEFSFAESRFVNAHTDYSMLVSNKKRVHLLFRKPNNRLSMYPLMINNGIFDFQPGTRYSVVIKTTDVLGNESRLEFEAEGSVQPIMASNAGEVKGTLFRYNANNYFEDSGIRLSVPAGSLYEDSYFDYARTESGAGIYPVMHYVGSKNVPLHLASSLSINASSIPQSYRARTMIAKINGNGQRSTFKSTWQGDWITAGINSFGIYTLETDTVKPSIVPVNIRKGSVLTGQKEIRFVVTDKLSGIRDYKGFIDNEWVLFEYEPKQDLVFYTFDRSRLKSGIKHDLVLYITDAAGNQSSWSANFTW